MRIENRILETSQVHRLTPKGIERYVFKVHVHNICSTTTDESQISFYDRSFARKLRIWVSSMWYNGEFEILKTNHKKIQNFKNLNSKSCEDRREKKSGEV